MTGARAMPDISGEEGEVVCSVSRARVCVDMILRETGGGAETRPLGDPRKVEVRGAETGPVCSGGEG